MKILAAALVVWSMQIDAVVHPEEADVMQKLQELQYADRNFCERALYQRILPTLNILGIEIKSASCQPKTIGEEKL